MDPATGAALITAGSELVGQVASMFGAQSANRANIQMSREQMAFQERMSNTQYQRAMADMRAAGLNPMLAYMQGGAGNVSGSMAHVENVAGDLGRVLPQMASSAMDAARLKKEMQLLDAQREKTLRDAEASGAQAQWMQTRNLIDQAVADPAFDRPNTPLLQVAWRRAQMASANAAAAYARAGVPERMGRGSIFETLRPIFETSAKGMWRLRRLVDPSGRPYGGGQ